MGNFYFRTPEFRRWPQRGGLIVSVALLGSVASLSPASAQNDEALMEARSKFQRGIELEQAANYTGALKLFREVGAVKMTSQVRYHIATCEEHLGQLVAALGGYELAMNRGEDMPPEFVSEVETSIAELKARIPKLIIARGEGAEAASIELDGVALGESSIGVEIPLDPGPHTVSATAPGYEDFQQTISVVESSAEKLELMLQPLVKEPAAASPPVVPEAATELRYGKWPYVLGGTGLALAAAGGVFLGVSQLKAGEVKELCGGTDCTDLVGTERDDAEKTAKTAQNLEVAGWVQLGVGLTATGVAAILYYLDHRRVGEKSAANSSTWRLVPAVSDREWAFHFSGTF